MKTFLTFVGGVLGLVLTAKLVGYFANGEHGFDWDAGTAAATAYGTLALALVTWRLGTKANDEADAVNQQAKAVRRQAAAVSRQVRIGRRQVEIGQQQLEASRRPFIVPSTHQWNPGSFAPDGQRHVLNEGIQPWVFLNNAGSGPGYSVRGALFWPNGIGGGAIIGPTAIPAGQTVYILLTGTNWAGLAIDWARVSGYIRYLDLAKTEWQTHFRYLKDPFSESNRERWSVDVVEVGKTENLGEPVYTLDGGWQNRPE
jgi:hypothetical protein